MRFGMCQKVQSIKSGILITWVRFFLWDTMTICDPGDTKNVRSVHANVLAAFSGGD